MGFDVGTVRFEYSNSPTGIRRKFAWYLDETTMKLLGVSQKAET